MTATLRLRVAGLTLSATTARRPEVVEPAPSYGPFLVARGGDIRLRVVDASPPRPAGPALFESGGVWRVHRSGRRLLYGFSAHEGRGREPRTYKAVEIDRALTSGVLYFPSGARHQPRYALDFPLDELLFQHRLAREGAIEVHGCAVVEAGRTLLFCGQSGAGKSTTAALWSRHRPQAATLSDDRVVLRLGRRAVEAHGTPWHGDGGYARAATAPLQAIFFIGHGRANRLTRVGPAEAAGRLFTRTFPPMWDRTAVTRLLAACSRTAERVPCFDFRFRPDASAVAAVLERVQDLPATTAPR